MPRLPIPPELHMNLNEWQRSQSGNVCHKCGKLIFCVGYGTCQCTRTPQERDRAYRRYCNSQGGPGTYEAIRKESEK